MIKRAISKYIKKLSKQVPVVTIIGPRQSGNHSGERIISALIRSEAISLKI